MELKQLNKIILILSFFIGINVFSQMNMSYINGEKLTINSKTKKGDFIKLVDDNNYTIYYIIDRKDFDLKRGLGTSSMANIIFFSKKYNKGILASFQQMIYHVKKNVYNISLSVDEHMIIPQMIIVDKNFNYEYLMTSYFGPLPNSDIDISRMRIQDYRDYCKIKKMSLNKIIIDEDINEILKILNTDTITSTNCEVIFEVEDLKQFFPKKIVR